MFARFKFLFEATSLHGFRHLVDQQKVGWKKGFARVFWTCFIAISFYQMVEMLKSTIAKGSKSTSINLDTNYRSWVNTFPAVSFCLIKGRTTTPIKASIGSEFTFQNGTKIKLAMRHYRAIQALMFANYQDPLEGIAEDACFEMNQTCGIDMEVQRKKLLANSCHDFMDKVIYMGREVKCSDIFMKFETELGTCFVSNSIYANNSNGKQNLESFDALPLRYSNHDINERSLVINYKDNPFFLYKCFIHTPEEFPNGKIENTLLKKIGVALKIDIKTTEFLNQYEVKYESIEARGCRYPFERLNFMNLPYSLNYCRYIKRVERELKTCNCTFPLGLAQNHTMRVCNVAEFQCLHNLAEMISHEMKTREGVMNNIGECLVPTCFSMEIGHAGEYEMKYKNLEPDFGVLKIEVINKPTLRYIRRVSFTRLDMMVQVGGIIGLFLGASVLSVLELLYLIYQTIKLKDQKNR